MDFFLEIHNGECGMGGHFCGQVRTSWFETVSTQAEEKKNQEEELNKESALS